MLKTRSQRFAADAHARVSELKGAPEDEQRAYRSMAQKLPVLIRTAGLAQALAFLEASSKREHRRLLEHLNQTVCPNEKLADLCRDKQTSLGEYMRLTRESLDALLWYKRFAESVLGAKRKPNGAEGGGGVAKGVER